MVRKFFEKVGRIKIRITDNYWFTALSSFTGLGNEARQCFLALIVAQTKNK
jgi:hypothetical protein